MVFAMKAQSDVLDCFRATHGNKYGYQKVIYKGAKEKVIIVCNEHGDFEQLAANHIAGNGCPKCAGKHKTTEQVIEEFKLIHGATYQYSKVDYKANNIKIIITCTEHGDFEQTPSHHRQGGRCPQCSNSKVKYSILERFVEVHGNTYDYSKVIFKKSALAVNIHCLKHGEFKMSPDRHIKGAGCPSCAKNEKTILETIALLAEIHANQYDYTQLNAVHPKTALNLTCVEHGAFIITLDCHLKGSACPSCDLNRKDNCGRSNLLTTEQVIEQFKAVHQDKYIYDRVKYLGNNIKVEIVCPSHGVFMQQPANHKQGNGCPKCASVQHSASNKKRFLTTEQVIEQFKAMHGERYDYSLVKYIGNQAKVEIVCLDHGSFMQTPDHHKKGRGCPKCANLARKGKAAPKPKIYATVREHLIATGQLIDA